MENSYHAGTCKCIEVHETDEKVYKPFQGTYKGRIEATMSPFIGTPEEVKKASKEDLEAQRDVLKKEIERLENSIKSRERIIETVEESINEDNKRLLPAIEKMLEIESSLEKYQ